ncbi:XRE family transcriptional regulator [Pontibacter sp. G13]|uniref:helix-turn-helix domain-containing protein n=1 Tax=Pontibacter sp. G13 TaxID=3074898 RepID=UPI00288B1F25|nr:XRE family transcriptional regulator [Pontibacter sp. G13]WNJ18133.1 XRE family transcriptional regulator [Pontibacter sp. G13]
MIINKQNIRLIFGLKLKQLRQQKGMSFAQLSKAAGVSVSYLNEIEKGKKYPKTDKIIALAQALGVSYDQLVSLKLNKKLAPIAELLNSGFLESLPLDLFGLEASTLLELISSAPTKINAFISTILKIARNYEMSQENFYFAALRSYQEMHDNYFEDLEGAVDAFVKEFDMKVQPPVSIDQLSKILTESYGYTIDSTTLDEHPELQQFRSVFSEGKKHLYINSNLSETQQAFQLGKEIAFHYLNLNPRPHTSNLYKVRSFDEVLNNFKASYFSVALLLNRHLFLQDMNQFFEQEVWKPDGFLAMMQRYQASPEMFMHRLSNLLPKYFGIDNFFFLRFNDYLDMPKDNFHITKELHLSQLHNPHKNDLMEHYCRRWVSIRILEQLKSPEYNEQSSRYLIDAQRSKFIGTKNEYLCISLARPNTPTPNTNVSVTLGIQVDNDSRKRIRFMDSDAIIVKEVNSTCERCPLTDCAERIEEPTIVQKIDEQAAIAHKLDALLNQETIHS